ncbi:MAG TPA: hypothetical protein VG033_04110 [Candidatus Acidoferrales bacterium]|jgi:hypothetical protein|nr:hypothetical protein [Candidatus Acidoferrales bacterium]
MEVSPLLKGLMIVWGVITAGLICLLIYRGTLSNREDDQIFLAAEESMAQEQRALIARIERLSRPITLLIVASCLIFLIGAGMWVWDAFHTF